MQEKDPVQQVTTEISQLQQTGADRGKTAEGLIWGAFIENNLFHGIHIDLDSSHPQFLQVGVKNTYLQQTHREKDPLQCGSVVAVVVVVVVCVAKNPVPTQQVTF